MRYRSLIRNGFIALLAFIFATLPVTIVPFTIQQVGAVPTIAQTRNNQEPSDKQNAVTGSFVDYYAEETQLKGHEGSVNGADFSLDGKFIATAGTDTTVRIWDFSGKELTILRGHTASVRSAKFSPNGKYIVSASFDGTARIWNLSDLTSAVLREHQDKVYSASFSPDGTKIVTSGGDGTARLWSMSGKLLRKIKADSNSVYTANFSPNGKRIVTAGADKIARVWDLLGNVEARLVTSLEGHTDTIWSASFSPDGKRVVTASDDNTARIWELSGKSRNQAPILREHKDSVYSASFSPDGKQIVTASVDFTGLVWDSSGKLLGKLRQHTGGVNSARFSPDGKWIVTASNDSTARIWNVNSRLLTELQGHQQEVRSANFSPNGNLIITTSDDKTVRIWDSSTKKIVEMKHQRSVERANFSPDSKLIVTLSSDYTARVWNTAGKLLTEITGLTPAEVKKQMQEIGHTHFNVENANFSPDSKYIVTGGYEGSVRIWDASGQLLKELKGHKEKIKSLSFSSDSKLMLTASDDKTARLWDVLSGKQLVEIKHLEELESAIFSSDGKHIVTITDWIKNNTIHVWSIAGKAIKEIKFKELLPVGNIFNQSNNLIITNDKHGTSLWDLSGKQVRNFQGYEGSISSDSQLIATKNENNIIVWDVLSGKQIVKLGGFNIKNYSFSRDGQNILTTSEDGIIRVWYLSNKSLSQQKIPNTIRIYDNIPQSKAKNSIKGFFGTENANFSPNGKLVVTTTGDKTEVWDISGKLLTEIEESSSASFSPDSKFIVTTTRNKNARVWDTDGKLITELQGNQNNLISAEFSEDGRQIFTATNNKAIHVWDIYGKLIKEYQGLQYEVKNIIFSNNKKLIITIPIKGNTVSVWSLSGKLLAELKGHDEEVNSASFSFDGNKIVTTSNDGTIRIWSIKGKQIRLIKVETGIFKTVSSACFSPNGELIVTTAGFFGGETANVWNISGKLLAQLQGHNSDINSANFSADGKFIITASRDKTARIWNTSGKQLQVFSRYSGFEDTSFSPNGKTVISVSSNGSAYIWDLVSTQSPIEIKEEKQGIKKAFFSNDSNKIITYSDKTVSVWNNNGKLLSKIMTNEYIKNVSLSTDGQKILITPSWEKVVFIGDLSGQIIAKLEGHKNEVSFAGFSNNGQQVITISDNIAYLWDISGKLIAQLKVHKKEIIFFMFSADDKQIFTLSLDGYFSLWDTTGKLLIAQTPNQNSQFDFNKLMFNRNIENINFSINRQNGQITVLATSSTSLPNPVLSASGSINLNKLTEFVQQVFSIPFSQFNRLNIDKININLHKRIIKITLSANLAISSISQNTEVRVSIDIDVNAKVVNNAEIIFAASNGDSAIVYNSYSPQFNIYKLQDIFKKAQPTVIKGHQDTINNIIFSPNGKYVVTSSNDGTIRVWNMAGKQQGILALSAPSSSPKIEASRLRDKDFYAPNCGEAFKPWQQALKIYQQLSDYENQAIILEKLGNAYYCISDYTEAIKHYSNAIDISNKINNISIKIKNTSNLGNIYNTLANYIEAEEYYNIALKTVDQNNNNRSKSEILRGRANTYKYQGKYNNAIADYLQALAIDEKNNNSYGEALNKLELASIYLASGEYSKAIQYYKETLYFNPATALAGLGNSYLALNNIPKAIDLYQQSLEEARKNEDKEAEANAFNNLAKALYKTDKDKLPLAEKYLRTAIKIWKALRIKLEDANKISIFEKQSFTYRLLQEVLIAQGKNIEALEIAEQGRARAFVDLLTKRITPDKQVKDNNESPNIEKIKQIAQDQNSTIVQYSIINNKSNLNDQQKAKELKLYIWVIKPTSKVIFREVDFQEALKEQNIDLEKLVVTARESFGVYRSKQFSVKPENTDKEDKAKQVKNLQLLYKLLIKRIEDTLPTGTNQRLIFIPQGELFLVPFPALIDEQGKYLVDKYTIQTAPSIQVLDLTREIKRRQSNQASNKQALIVGNPTMPTVELEPGKPAIKLPNLPKAEKEAETIAALLKTQAITGNQATKATIIQRMKLAPIIHLATHGILDNIRGLGSALAFAPSGNDNGLLTADEIFNLPLKDTNMVVLSACNTGRGRITGDGVIGLSRSFIRAGVPSVVVSLWAVPDNATAFLMTEFYHWNLDKKLDKATALQKAMQTTKLKYPNPRQWAAFTLIGEAS